MRSFPQAVAVAPQVVCALIIPAESALGHEHGYCWYLYQDGTIEYKVKLTGVISNGALPSGQLVAPQVYGPNRQHIFCVRLDMMVDGPGNTVLECDSVALPPGPDNPHGNAWVVRQYLGWHQVNVFAA